MTVYKGCPYCNRTFEIGPEDHGPMKHHIRREHADVDPLVPLDVTVAGCSRVAAERERYANESPRPEII